MYDLCLNKLIDYIILQCQKEKNGDKGELINQIFKYEKVNNNLNNQKH